MWTPRHSGFWECDFGWSRRIGPRSFRAGVYANHGREYGPFRTLEDAKQWVAGVAVGAVALDRDRLAS